MAVAININVCMHWLALTKNTLGHLMPKFSSQVETTPFNCIKTMHLELANRQAIQIVCLGFFIAIAGHVTHLPVWVSLFIGFSLTWRLAQNMNYVPALARWLIVPFVLAGGIGVFATY